MRDAVEHVIAELNAGRLRVAERQGVGQWTVNQWVKKAVLLSFRLNDNQRACAPATWASSTRCRPSSRTSTKPQMRATGVRVVPPAVARRGSYIAKNVVLMPSYVNIGAYVDEGTMVDTWATVGSCAQIGKNVHLSGGVGIGGVLEPLQANPTIIEDNCFIGARSEVVEGVIVEENSVISMGVFIGQSTKIYDRATGEVSYGRVPAGLGGGQRQPAQRRRQVQPVLRGDRQAGRRADARQDQHQRTAARLSDRASDTHTEEHGMARCGNMERVLRLMAEKKASDVYLSANSPILIKINGQILQLSRPAADADAAAPAAGRAADAAAARGARRDRRAEHRHRHGRRRQLPPVGLPAARHASRRCSAASRPRSRRSRPWACRRC